MSDRTRTPTATRGRRPRPRRIARLVLLAAGLATVAACAKVAGIDALEIGQCKGGGVCGAETGAVDDDGATMREETGTVPEGGGAFDASTLPCPTTPGPSMVRVGTATNNFCIDSTEVTVGQYRAFTDAKGADVSGQPAECSWNATYAAATGGSDEIPIAGVDWCDARAFCSWAGKRLCGKHAGGKFAGAIGSTELGDFNTHEWLLACTDLGQLTYPYGSIQNKTACNTGENDAGRTLAVRSKDTCQGGFPGVYDMVGNVWEWFDGPCPPPDAGADAGDGGPAKEQCIVKGGGYPNVGANINCRVDGLGASRDTRATEIGFRCCAD
jgi:sulfatase modifying factor 1